MHKRLQRGSIAASLLDRRVNVRCGARKVTMCRRNMQGGRAPPTFHALNVLRDGGPHPPRLRGQPTRPTFYPCIKSLRTIRTRCDRGMYGVYVGWSVRVGCRRGGITALSEVANVTSITLISAAVVSKPSTTQHDEKGRKKHTDH